MTSENSKLPKRIFVSCTIASLTLIALWIMSYFVWVDFQEDSQPLAWTVSLLDGRGCLFRGSYRYHKPYKPGFHIRAPLGDRSFSIGLLYVARYSGGILSVSLPLHIPVLISLLLTGFSRRAQVKSESPLACKNCGYNLTGNTSGICPECGAPCAVEKA